jgi:erythromycin esterase
MHRLRFVRLVVLLAAILLSGVVPAGSQGPDSDVAAWLQAHVIPLNTVESGGSYEDLMPLEAVIGDARIVALGEATHGTHEFFTLKPRMVEFLVREMGFTVLAMEANWPEAERLNRYVQTGEGNPAELLAGLHFWTWNAQEVLDLVEWLRSYNQNPANSPRVRFAGFDAQAMELAVNNTLAYLRGVAPEDADLAATRYACLDDFHLLGPEPAFSDYGQRPLSETQPCGDRVRAVYDDLIQNRSRYTALSSEETYNFAVRNALTVVQAEAVAACRYTDGPHPRDRYMAQNVAWLLEQVAQTPGSSVGAQRSH